MFESKKKDQSVITDKNKKKKINKEKEMQDLLQTEMQYHLNKENKKKQK